MALVRRGGRILPFRAGRLGRASTETTQLYALLADKVADAEIRAASGFALSRVDAIACIW